MDSANIEAIVKQVLKEMTGGQTTQSAPKSSTPGAIPKTAHVAMLTSLEHLT